MHTQSILFTDMFGRDDNANFWYPDSGLKLSSVRSPEKLGTETNSSAQKDAKFSMWEGSGKDKTLYVLVFLM